MLAATREYSKKVRALTNVPDDRRERLAVLVDRERKAIAAVTARSQ